MVAQCRPLIVLAEQPASLQFRHHLRREVVEAGRQEREGDIETVRTLLMEPLLHLVGDGLWCADEGKTRITAQPLGKLAHCQALASGKLDHPFTAGFAGVRFRNIRQGTVGIEAGNIVAERNRERGDCAVIMDETVEPGAFGFGLFDAVADENESARQDDNSVARTARRDGPLLDVLIKALPAASVGVAAKPPPPSRRQAGGPARKLRPAR